MSGYKLLRWQKLVFSLKHPFCWKALAQGVVPSIEHRKALSEMDCDFILDVGANRGQFSLIARMTNREAPIVAFEPIPAEAEIFRKSLSGKNVQLYQTALGEEAGEVMMHLSRSADSSSLLPIGETQSKLFRDTNEIGILKVPVKRLDDFRNDWNGYSRLLLKIDVQGFELSVLKGANLTLKSCAYVYVECSEIELYVGQALYREVADFLNERGFKVQSRHNETVADGKLIQADYLFARI